MSLDVGYFRRWYGNFSVTDNLAVPASGYDRFSIVAPTDPRLPGGGGNTLSGLNDLNPAYNGLINNQLRLADNYGTQIQRFNGFDLTVNARPRGGVTLYGGVSTGKTVNDNCEILAAVPEAGATSGPVCHRETLWLTQLKLSGVYVVPRVDVQVSGAFQSIPGPQVQANYNVTTALTQGLGRPLTFGLASVPLFPQGQVLGDRLQQLDLRIGKILRFGRTENSRESGCLQRVQFERGTGGKQHLFKRFSGGLARADQHRHRPIRQDQCAVRLLTDTIGLTP